MGSTRRRGWGRARVIPGFGDAEEWSKDHLRQPLGRCARLALGFELLLLGGMLRTVPLRRWLSRWIHLGGGYLGLGGGKVVRWLHPRPKG